MRGFARVLDRLSPEAVRRKDLSPLELGRRWNWAFPGVGAGQRLSSLADAGRPSPSRLAGPDRWTLILGIVLVVLLTPARPAHASDLDAPAPPPGPVQVRAGEGGGDASAGPGRPQAAAPRGNPLWSLPLDRLEATRARPIFAPSRRPPAVAEAPPPLAPAAPVVVAPARPRVALIGTVVGQGDAYGIFLDPAGNAVLRLRTGESFEGWVLRSVSVRDALLQNGRNSVVLALPTSGSGGATPTARAPDGSPMLARPGRPAGERPTAHIIAPYRPPPALSDIESSH